MQLQDRIGKLRPVPKWVATDRRTPIRLRYGPIAGVALRSEQMSTRVSYLDITVCRI